MVTLLSVKETGMFLYLLVLFHSIFGKVLHMVNDRGHVCGTPQFYTLQGLVVGSHHSWYPLAERVLGVAVESKLMRDLHAMHGGMDGINEYNRSQDNLIIK